MSVTHSFECKVHGGFEARVEAGSVPDCPQGCSAFFVQLVFITPPSIGSEKVRTASRLVREMADMQGLTDIDVSPSTPGDSVADKNFKRSGNPIRPQAVGAGEVSRYIGAQLAPGNGLAAVGLGHPYDSREWRADKQTGHKVHYASPPLEPTPINQFGVEMTRVRGKP